MSAKALLSSGRVKFADRVAAEHERGRSADHNFRGINTCAGACVSPHIQPVPRTKKSTNDLPNTATPFPKVP